MVEHQATSSAVAAQVQYRDIPDFPGYRVGDDGSVWTCWVPRKRYTSNKWRKMSPAFSTGGYPQINFHNNGKVTHFFVHRLILTSFVGPCPEGMECRHLNSIRTDCRLSNLRWGARQENMKDRNDCNGTARGECNGQSKLTARNVQDIRVRYAAGESRTHLAAEFGVSRSCISWITTRKKWKHI